ncbi:MAG: menaquinone biosynthesis protein [Saprospiraceae bacterium]|nr:menaquinone biosynthesis protein [Saprospiraceae bacterium]
MKPVRLVAVSYLNTKPFIYGLYKRLKPESFELTLDIPSGCARRLLNGEADLALMPVGALPDLEAAYLVSHFCIGATGPVKTVCLYAEKPLGEIKRVLLDYHSRTSVLLVQILFRHYWQREVAFEQTAPGFEAHIKEDTAALIIGDRTIGLDKRYRYVYDLGEAWTTWTGLPFVFAAWVSRHPIGTEFEDNFNTALQAGIDHIPELIKILPAIPGLDAEQYFRQNISYTLDAPKWAGLKKFLSLVPEKSEFQLLSNSFATH